MSQTKFYHPEDIQDSVESLFLTHGRDRPYVYWILLLVVSGAVVSLPLVRVDMSVGAPGQVRPAIERISVYPAVDGFIKEVHVADNHAVKKGEPLLVIESLVLDTKIAQNQRQREENLNALHDLGILLDKSILAAAVPQLAEIPEKIGIDASWPDGQASYDYITKLKTANYVRQFTLFVSDLNRSTLQRQKVQQESARRKVLHERGLLSDQDFDQDQYAQAGATKETEFLIQQTLNRWQADKIERELREIDLDSEAKQLSQQREFYTLRAPIDGTTLGFFGLNSGVYIPAGQRLGEISPEESLQADVYVSTKDVGFVRPGQRVSIQVDAFPYTEWGTIPGTVRDVSQDFVQIGQQLAFKVVVDLATTRLKSSSGTAVELRRGMTVNARFIVKKRTLFNMLYSKLSESLDPTAKASD